MSDVTRRRQTVGGLPTPMAPLTHTTRQRIRLADGRDLFYFDRGARRDHGEHDRRTDLPPPIGPSDVRWDPLRRERVVIAADRQARTYKPPAALCPLDPSTPSAPTEIPGPYEVAVFENRFPAFSTHITPTIDDGVATSTYVMSESGLGRCEVVCFTSDHDTSFGHLPPARVRTVIDAWIDRTRDLSRLPTAEYIFCFENRGEQIGVTLGHPHGQIYAYPFLPPHFATMGQSAAEHRHATGCCLQCELLDAELRYDRRIVHASRYWVAYVPFAARWPYEIRLVPRQHRADLPALDEAEKDDLSEVYPLLLNAFDRLFSDRLAPYIASWQQAPVRRYRDGWHLAAEIFTIRRAEAKLKYLAGSESAAGVWINDIAPEDAADRLRDAVNST